MPVEGVGDAESLLSCSLQSLLELHGLVQVLLVSGDGGGVVDVAGCVGRVGQVVLGTL